MRKKKRRKLDAFAQEFFRGDIHRLGIPLAHFQGNFPRRRTDVQISKRLDVIISIEGDGWLLREGGEMVLHDGVKESLAMLVKLYLEYRNPDYVFTVVIRKP